MRYRESDIQTRFEPGSGNMGDVADAASKGRGCIYAPSFALARLRVTFSAGTGSATLTLKRDSGRGATFDQTLWTFAGVGNGGVVVNWRVRDEDLPLFVFGTSPITQARDVPVLTWTDPGTSTWLIEWGLVDGAALDAH